MVLLGLLNSCIEEYIPDIPRAEANKYCVYGQMTTEREEQEVSITLASSIRDPNPVPLNDCHVRIRDQDGNAFEGREFEAGEYSVRVPGEYLTEGMSYRLEVTTPAGTRLVSDYEELLVSPDIDSVYYVREQQPTGAPDVFRDGVQFYLDFNAPGDQNAYFKFDLVATYEYHSRYPLEWYYDGILHHVDPPDYSHMVCWTTEQIMDIFILNTAQLEYNEYKRYPLHYVDNTSPRLVHGYSLLVRQYSLSEKAYLFWDQLRANNMERGQMYETQPLPVQGNLVNLTHPEQAVLGYFQVSEVKTRRLFISQVPDLEFNYWTDCGVFPIDRGLEFYPPYLYPIYLSPDFAEVTPECIFCDQSVFGETIEKPDFWPDSI